MTNREAFTAAHALTRETVARFPGADYRTTFAAALRIVRADAASPSIIRRGVDAIAAEIVSAYAEGEEMDDEDAEDLAALPGILAAETRMMATLDDYDRRALASVDPAVAVTALLTDGVVLSVGGVARNAIYKMYAAL